MNQEREDKNKLSVELMRLREENNRLADKVKVNEAKAKKCTEAQNDAKRKQRMITDKNRQIEHLQRELDD